MANKKIKKNKTNSKSKKKILFKNDTISVEELIDIAIKSMPPTLVKKTKYYYIERIEPGEIMQEIIRANGIDIILDKEKFYKFSVKVSN